MTPAQSAGFDLRPAAPGDVPLILTLIRELAEFERLAHEVSADESLLEQHLFGTQPAAEVLIAFDRTTRDPAGFALFFQNFSTFLAKPGIYLEDLYVRPAFRRRGLGRALLARLGALAVERGCGRLEWAVLDWNEDAIGFYRQLGAKVLDDWRICRVTGPALRTLGGPPAGVNAPRKTASEFISFSASPGEPFLLHYAISDLGCESPIMDMPAFQPLLPENPSFRPVH